MKIVQDLTSTVLASDSQTATTSTATASAGTNGQRYHITGIDASYSSGSQTGLLQIKDGNTVIWQQYITGSGNYNFPSAIRAKPEQALSAILAAGAASIIGTVNLRGYLL